MDTNRLDCTQSTIASTREVEKEGGRVVVLDGTTCQENSTPMIRENRQLVTVEPVEFEEYPIEVQDCRKITDHFRGIHEIYPILIKENRRMSTCNCLDLQTLASEPVMPKNLPDHWG